MLLDIQWWLEFLPRYRRISLIKPFLWDFESLNFSTDACLRGGSATCQTECISFVFPDCISMSSLHINALELFTIVVALKHWAPQLQGCKFIVACDNSAAVAVITSNASKDPFMQRCLRQMWFTAAPVDFEVCALHVPGRHNQFADYLSRWHSDPLARDSFYCLSLRSRRLEVVGERENGHARGRHARGEGAPARKASENRFNLHSVSADISNWLRGSRGKN